jgi:hypothetical protein
VPCESGQSVIRGVDGKRLLAVDGRARIYESGAELCCREFGEGRRYLATFSGVMLCTGCYIRQHRYFGPNPADQAMVLTQVEGYPCLWDGGGSLSVERRTWQPLSDCQGEYGSIICPHSHVRMEMYHSNQVRITWSVSQYLPWGGLTLVVCEGYHWFETPQDCDGVFVLQATGPCQINAHCYYGGVVTVEPY